VESSSPEDRQYLATDRVLRILDQLRDGLALPTKGELAAAAFAGAPVRGTRPALLGCRALISAAHALAASGLS
jgi:hypothetical protein